MIEIDFVKMCNIKKQIAIFKKTILMVVDKNFLEAMMIDTKLLDILACPACKGDVEYDARNEKIICTECKKKYPVKDGIPVMLVEEAE